MIYQYIWVFQGEGSRFPSGLFEELEIAEHWINTNKATGILTHYLKNISVYDWAIEHDYFKPSKTHEFSEKFKQNFTCASLKHHHYCEGISE